MTGRDPGWENWARTIPEWGNASDQWALVEVLAQTIYTIGRDKMIIWPGGPPVGVHSDAGEAAAIAIAIIIVAGAAA